MCNYVAQHGQIGQLIRLVSHQDNNLLAVVLCFYWLPSKRPYMLISGIRIRREKAVFRQQGTLY